MNFETFGEGLGANELPVDYAVLVEDFFGSKEAPKLVAGTKIEAVDGACVVISHVDIAGEGLIYTYEDQPEIIVTASFEAFFKAEFGIVFPKY